MKKIASIQLIISIIKRDDRYIAYSPALDLSSSGKSIAQAKKRLVEAAFLLLEELNQAGTTKDVLVELGWRFGNKQWQPPKISSQKLNVSVAA